ncbi:MAG: putative ArsR family transcriptional regulator [Natronomonas sp.]|jgi:predicted ArsR family transcriptional regulator|uniref:ArsR/SmtB family transcription factor n=1 Tax=Natronomonas sp. TaxID=2184060 RepID=UPI003989B6DA
MPTHDLVPSDIDLDAAEPPTSVSVADGEVLEALSSSTARLIVSVLRGDPSVKSAIARKADVSIQVAAYHLDRLEAAGLVAVVGTACSEKGREMDVYALTTDSLRIELCDKTA